MFLEKIIVTEGGIKGYKGKGVVVSPEETKVFLLPLSEKLIPAPERDKPTYKLGLILGNGYDVDTIKMMRNKKIVQNRGNFRRFYS